MCIASEYLCCFSFVYFCVRAAKDARLHVAICVCRVYDSLQIDCVRAMPRRQRVPAANRLAADHILHFQGVLAPRAIPDHLQGIVALLP